MKTIHMLLILGIIFAVGSMDIKPSAQTVVPQCFSKEDCIKSVAQGFCGIEYDCYAGKCWSNNIICTETCNDKIDNDYDSLIDCADPNCWTEPYCPCSEMSYSTCLVNRCWCPTGKLPRWHLESDNHFCQCD